ncbi:hypothetical protein EMCRGX_G012811 [Ephydatia muelleri]
MDKSKNGEVKLANGSTADHSRATFHNVRSDKRNGLARVFEAKESSINRLLLGDHTFQAVYDVCAVHIVLFAAFKVLRDSLAAGRLTVELPLLYLAMGDFNLKGIVAFVLTELLLLSLAVCVYPGFMAWKMIRTKFPTLPVDIGFLLVYVLGLVAALATVLWAVFTVPICPALSFIVGVEQVRLSMKTYSFVRETAKKILTPWNKDDTTGPAVYYAGQMEPQVGTIASYLYFLFAPTLLYRDRYPRNNGPINWKNVIAYAAQAMHGDTMDFRHSTVVMSILNSFAVGFVILVLFNIGILHSWMNMHAELLRFADRQFYTDWWTANSYAVFYRKWNAIVHDWIHAYIFTDIKTLLGARGLGNIVPAFLSIAASSIIHEYLLAIGLGFCMPYLSMFFGGAGVVLYLFNPCFLMKRVSNVFILVATGMGMGIITFGYLLEFMSRHYCPPEPLNSNFFFSSHFFHCYQMHN